MRRLRVASFQKEGVTVKSVAEGVAGQMGIKTGALLIRGRKNGRSIGRKIVAAIAHRTYGIPLVEIARYFGIGSSSISRMLEQGEAYAKENTISLKH
jgi:hypothetical protein